MKICWMGYLAKNHSWSIVAQHLCREFIKLGHRVDMFSTNGIEHFPDDLKPYLKGAITETTKMNEVIYNELIGSKLDKQYDMQISYTAFPNFNKYFIRGNKNRFGIWNYETSAIPKGFAKYHQYVDKILPSSEFSKKIFTDNGIPDNKQVVVPHGINLERFNNHNKYPLKTKKKYVIGVMIAQLHYRKNIGGILEAYGKAFTNKDNVCLMLKIVKQSAQPGFDISFNDIFNSWKKKYPQHGEVEVIDKFIVDIETLYNRCDVIFNMSLAECWHLPSIEGLAANKIVVSPRYGGQLDFLNDDNSILIDGKIIRAHKKMQYWEQSPYAKAFEPNTDQAALKLKDVIENYDSYLEKLLPNMKKIVNKYSWENAAKQILELCQK